MTTTKLYSQPGEKGADTNQANELFKLYKEVYERTGWETEDIIVIDKRFGGGFNNDLIQQKLSVWKKKISDYQTNHNVSDEKITEQFAYYPLYTSDYLLEKLPATVKNDFDGGNDYIILYKKGKSWYADYMGQFKRQKSDTPLKALLKLTIALSEAGEL